MVAAVIATDIKTCEGDSGLKVDSSAPTPTLAL